MPGSVPDVLARIVEQKREELPRLRGHRTRWERDAEARTASSRRDFHQALIIRPPAIIAEIKKASPSKGLLSADFRPEEIARAYEAGGASALSVLTDVQFFQGKLEDLVSAWSATSLPVLRKDFTLEETHIAQAAAHGADAVLLIAALLETEDLRRLREYAAGFHLASLVEVHDAEELSRAIDSGAAIIGVNNRNLRTFEVTLDTSLRLAERIPAGVVRVSESGIHNRGDVDRLLAAGFQAFLVGEHLMKAGNPAEALKALAA